MIRHRCRPASLRFAPSPLRPYSLHLFKTAPSIPRILPPFLRLAVAPRTSVINNH